MEDPSNFTEFYVDAAGASATDLEAGLARASAGVLRDGHAWVKRSYLESALDGTSESWRDPFEKMVAYADANGWVSGGGDAAWIRAHLEHLRVT